jgi:hypothetical protein
MKSVLYLHGLESKQGGPKVDFLKTVFEEVYAPALDYKGNPNLFQELLEQLRAKPVDLLIGSSMGGHFAYCLATHLNIPTLLFNPALLKRSVQVNTAEGDFQPKHRIMMGRKDELVLNTDTLAFLKERGIEAELYYGEHGHRTPYEVFVESVAHLKI